MTGAEIDAVKERADAVAWEDANAEDPRLTMSVDFLRLAVQAIESAEMYLHSAAGEIDGRPDADRIISLKMSAEGLEMDVQQQIERM